MINEDIANQHNLIVRAEEDNEHSDIIKWSDAIRQITASICESCLVIQSGIAMSYSAVLLPQLSMPSSEIPININEASWIASLLSLFLPIGSLSTGVFIDKFGRKKVSQFLCIPFIVIWLIFAFSTNITHIYIARIFSGVFSGLTSVVLIYVGEIAHVSFRPMLLGLNSVFVSLGILITCVFSLFCNWRQLAYVYCISVIITFVLLLPIPESPVWYHVFRTENNEHVVKSIQWLYKRPEVFRVQYEKILKEKHFLSTSENYQTKKNKLSVFLRTYLNPVIYKPFIVLFFLFLFQQLSGAYLIIFYAVDIFKLVGGNSGKVIDEYVALVMLGTIRFVMAIMSMFLSKRFRRKPLLYTSGIGMSISSLSISLCTLKFEHHVSDWIGILSVLSYVCWSSMGVLVIPWTLTAELLPTKVRGMLGGILVSFAYIDLFIVLKIFPSLLNVISIQVIFAFFSFMSFVLVCFVYIFLPESFGKSIVEIEKSFMARR